MRLKLILNKCVWHPKVSRSYLEAHADAEIRKEAGMWQRQCLQCKLWFWEDEFGGPKEEK